jgi:uncharacterized protein YkwD
MGSRVAFPAMVVVFVVAGVLALRAVTGGGDVVGAEARAAQAHASGASSALPSIARAKMNAFRARHGRGRLRYSRSLTRSATRHARYMLRHGFGHLSVVRASRRFRSVAELILKHRGHGQPATAVGGWAHSPAHRSLMLNGRYRSVGIGQVSGRGATYWVAHVGRR